MNSLFILEIQLKSIVRSGTIFYLLSLLYKSLKNEENKQIDKLFENNKYKRIAYNLII